MKTEPSGLIRVLTNDSVTSIHLGKSFLKLSTRFCPSGSAYDFSGNTVSELQVDIICRISKLQTLLGPGMFKSMLLCDIL